MGKVVLFSPSEEAVDGSVDARKYVSRLSRRAQLERRDYPAGAEIAPVGEDVDSVAVLGGLSGLLLESGYMEMGLETVFQQQELLRRLRAALPGDFPIVAIVDDAYSDYVMATYLKAGASAVVGTGGQLFGLVRSRVSDWDLITPYFNVFHSV